MKGDAMKTTETAGPQYLATPIAEKRQDPPSRYGMTVDGYTRRSGAPSSYMIRLAGERRWRRVMIWQFSNVGTAFVRVKGQALIISDADLICEEGTR